MILSDKFLVEKLNRLIDEHLDDPAFSIDTVCQSLGLSRSQLHRIVKEQTELSTSLYIRKRRLLRAQYLLLSTDLRISEISDHVGFSNAQNFSTYFTDEFGITPTDFRKRQATLSEPIVATEIVLQPELRPDRQPLAAPESTPKPSPAPRTRWLYVSIMAGLLLVLGVGLYGWQQAWYIRRPTKPANNSLAILPFTNLGSSERGPTCEGILDDVHRSISLIRNLKVIARSSSDQYNDTKKSIWQIGNELQVANILKGSVLKTGEQIQIKLELINTQEDVRVWQKKYRSAYKDIFQLTDQIVRDVAGQLTLPAQVVVDEKAGGGRTQNLGAYNAFLQGRQLLISRMEPDLLASLVRFDRALALDTTFADAYAGKAVAYHLLLGTTKFDRSTLNRLTEENALKAIRLDPTNSTAYGVLGSLYYATYQWQASENAFQIALQHNPNDAQVNHWYALLLRTTGRIHEAVRYSTQAIALDPLHPVMMSVYISNCSLAGQFEVAKAGIETGRELFDKSFAFQLGVAYYWLCRADYGRAAAHFQQMLALNPDDKGQIPLIYYCEAKQGNRQKAIQFLHDLTATTPRSDYERAVVYAGLNQADSSLYYLKKAADGGYLYRDTKVMPVFKPYRSHPVFKAVMHRFELPEL